MESNILMEIDPLNPYTQYNYQQTNIPYAPEYSYNYTYNQADTSKYNHGNDKLSNGINNGSNGTNNDNNKNNLNQRTVHTNQDNGNRNLSNGTQNGSLSNGTEKNSSQNEEQDVKPDLNLDLNKNGTKKTRNRKSSYWNKKVDKNFPFYGCAVCNISFMEIQQLDQHVNIHSNRLTSYDVRKLSKKKKKKLKKEKKKIKKESKVKNELEIEIKPEDGYIGNNTADNYTKQEKLNDNECSDHNGNENNGSQVNGNNGSQVNGTLNGTQINENESNGKGKNGIKNNDISHVKVYKCFACNKEFALSYYLRIHVRSHTDDKPYSCKLCNESFITASKLGRHNKRAHMPSSRKQCRICYKLFKRFDLLVAHFDKLHADDKLEGEPYDYNAIIPYLPDLSNVEGIEKQEPDVKPKDEEPWPGADDEEHPGEAMKVEGEKVILQCKPDFEARTFFNENQAIGCDEIKIEPVELEDKQDESLQAEEIKSEDRIDHVADTEERDDDDDDPDYDVKGEDSSESDYFPSDGCAAAAWSPPSAPRAPPGRVCHVCNKTFSSKSYLSVHMRTHTGERPFRCYICARGFITANKMHRHVLTHKDWQGEIEAPKAEGDDIKTECDSDDVKDKESKSKPKARVKKQKVQEPKGSKLKNSKRQHVCEFCNKKFLHLSTLQIHRKCHDGEQVTFKCHYCLQPQPDAAARAEHERSHTGPKPYLCTTCNKEYAKRESLLYHAKSHCGAAPLVCELCSLPCRSATRLARHVAAHARDHFVTRYECPVCAHLFHTAYHAAMHLRTHIKEGLIQEESKSAVLAMVLQNARRIPTSAPPAPAPDSAPTPDSAPAPAPDERSRVCNICGQTFTHFTYLEQHLNSHATELHTDKQEKKYQCPICSKSFKLHYYLKLHSFTHSKEKPFICQQCGKGFITKGKLKRHLETHQGLKKYQCHVCYKFFTRPSYLRIHVRTIHGVHGPHDAFRGIGGVR